MLNYHFSPPGFYKSYTVMANEIIPALRAGRHVYGNIDGLDLREISLLVGRVITNMYYHPIENKQELQRLFRVEPNDPHYLAFKPEKGGLLVIDEMDTWFFHRDWEDTDGAFVSFLTNHRHLDYDVVMMGVTLGHVDKAIVELGGMYHEYLPYKVMGIPLANNKYRIHYRKGVNEAPLRSELFTVDVRIFRCYRSALAIEEQTKKRFKMHRAIPIIVACLIFFGWSHFERR